MARKTMKTFKKLADADLGAVSGASGLLFDLSPILAVTNQSNTLNQVSVGNGNGSLGIGGAVGNTSQSAMQGNSSSTTIVHF